MAAAGREPSGGAFLQPGHGRRERVVVELAGFRLVGPAFLDQEQELPDGFEDVLVDCFGVVTPPVPLEKSSLQVKPHIGTR
ncbi:hypothetical protein [Kibdelosporangium aridum]|uniref:hypothetical protein n=1 Tax=Kibdelosporangium aridum TaxID=2030 RepID=UPI000F788100|nr:hypothetical protein [Kibdelosporangium aridum]